MKPHRGTLVLVLGILGLILCGPLLGIPAWIIGHGDLKDMAAGQMDPNGRDITKIGMILGIVSTALFVVGAIIMGILMLGGIAMGIKSQ